jgi:DNA-binding CsgD family transcriptional regulator/tetratricopeptide (TPR) repeat protein
MCEALEPPVPLAPILDMHDGLTEPVREALDRGGAAAELRRLMLEDLRHSGATLMVLEDAHGADTATLDLLRYLGRRLRGVPALVVVSFRAEELGPTHPLRVLAGDLATSPVVQRVSLPRLSERGVRALLAGSPLDPVLVHRRTGGNPFLVTELRAAGTDEVPASVRDVMLARVARLSTPAREMVEALACLGGNEAPAVVAAVAGHPVERLDDSVVAGLVVVADGKVAFRHDLNRDAVLASLAPSRDARLRRRALRTLERMSPGRVPAARLAEYAARAGDDTRCRRYSMAAAEEAAGIGAHREAAAQYTRVAELSVADAPADRARLAERIGQHSYLADDLETSLEAWTDAADQWHELGDSVRESAALVGLSITALLGARWVPRGAEACERAVRLLEVDGFEGPEAALAWAIRAKLAVMGFRNRDAVSWAERALQLCGQRTADVVPRALALMAKGAAVAQLGDASGLGLMETAVRLTTVHGHVEEAGLAYFWLHHVAVSQRRYSLAQRWYDEALRFTSEHDQEVWRQWLRAYHARALMEQGHWDDAVAVATDVLRAAKVDDGRRMISLVVLGRIGARRGDATAVGLLEEARSAMTPAESVVGWLVGSVPALAEAAHCAGRPMEAVTLLAESLPDAIARAEPWSLGEMAYWLWRAGRPTTAPAAAAEPFAAMITGHSEDAARQWRALGCPYEAALALSDAGNEGALREAVRVFDSLGAQPARQEAARRLRHLGSPSPRRSTSSRDRSGALTPREAEVLELLRDGFRNAEIADRLCLSRRTVEHHVAAILRKLGVTDRVAAGRLARESAVTVGAGEATPPENGARAPELPSHTAVVQGPQAR